MKILFFHRWVGVHSGGTETHIKELALRLAKRGHQVDILTREGKELKNFAPEVKIWRVSKNWRESRFSYEDFRLYWHTILFMFKSFLKLISLRLRGRKYDVVSVHFVTEAWVIRLIRRIFGWPYLFILEGYTDLEAREAKYANLQIAISQYEVNQCFKRYGYKPLFIPIGIDLERFNTAVEGAQAREKYSRNNDEKFILTVCRLEPRKDISTLISAAKIVCQKNNKIKFLLVGEGISRKKIEEQIKKAKLLDKIILTGQVKDEELASYYRACDLFVLPTLEEGFGIVLLEAMACGLPVISTTVGAVPEVVGDAGILVSPKKPDLLAEKILTVLENDDLRREMSHKGLKRVKRYDWDTLIVKYERAYSSCIKGENLPGG